MQATTDRNRNLVHTLDAGPGAIRALAKMTWDPEYIARLREQFKNSPPAEQAAIVAIAAQKGVK